MHEEWDVVIVGAGPAGATAAIHPARAARIDQLVISFDRSIIPGTIDRAFRTGDLNVLKQYERRIAGELKPRYLGYELAQRWLSIGWLNDLVAARAARSPYLGEAIAGVLHETVDPRAVCSARGLVTSFLK